MISNNKKQNLRLGRRKFLYSAGVLAAGSTLAGCDTPPADRYNQADIDLLAMQRRVEQQSRGKGIYGKHIYQGYRGLAQLPWFDIDKAGQLRCIDETVPMSIDVHSHLGMSVLFKPTLDLQASTNRVKHLLDCDGTAPGCPLDLDIYINGNFSDSALSDLSSHTIAQGLWGSSFAATQTIPNLLREMKAMRVEHGMLLPIKLGLPFGDSLTTDWRSAVNVAGASDKLHVGLSVHPRDNGAIEEMRAHALAGGRIIKLHPPVQRFYPDEQALMDIYAEAEKLGLVVFFHGGRAGIEPESSHPYAMPRHYEAALAEFPQLQFVLGHAGARDSDAMLDLAVRYENAWQGIHGQSLTHLEKMIQRTNGDRLLFGTDWPFYHIGASLAKVLIVTATPTRQEMRQRILRDNAKSLFPRLWA
jgi:predicted TIM-barrel fold metal-dependent hydrolase